jgi:hypothetical protein
VSIFIYFYTYKLITKGCFAKGQKQPLKLTTAPKTREALRAAIVYFFLD